LTEAAGALQGDCNLEQMKAERHVQIQCEHPYQATYM
jgi:hypothetical protein